VLSRWRAGAAAIGHAPAPMASDFILSELRGAGLDRLEALYARAQDLSQPPRGLWRGTTLRRLQNPGARRALYAGSERLLFEWIPWGIDFDRGRWFFFHPALGAGSFELRAQRSRWRQTDTFGLHYERSRLPGPIRGLLYDEVKPLSPAWMIGIGGIDAGRDQGDHFFYVVERIEEAG